MGPCSWALPCGEAHPSLWWCPTDDCMQERERATIMHTLCSTYIYMYMASFISRSRPAFRCLQYEKPGRAWYLFSCEYGRAELTSCVSCIVQPSMLSVYDSCPPLAVVIRYLVTLAAFAVWGPCATHAQLNPFYHPFYTDVTHTRKDTRPSPAFPYCKQQKPRQGLGMRLVGT